MPYRTPAQPPRRARFPSETVLFTVAALLAALALVAAGFAASFIQREPECWRTAPSGMRWMVPCDE